MIRRSKGRKYILMALGLALATTGVGLAAYVVDKSHIETDIPVESDERVICYAGTGSYKREYTSIEKALTECSTNTIIYVYPNLTNADGSLYQVHIKEDCTIPEGCSLYLPYKIEGNVAYLIDYDDNGTATGSPYFGDQTEELVKQNRKTQVIIDPGVTLTVLGSLGTGGVLCNPTTVVAGNTSGAYTEITLSDNASIVCESKGAINCYGYIKRTSNNNGSKITLKSGANLYSPFVIYDYKGGTATFAINNLADGSKFCPFQIFDFCNLQTVVQVNSGAIWMARACVYISADSTYYPTAENDKKIKFIGTSADDSMFYLRSGSIEVNYCPAVNGITTNETNSAKTYVTIKGSVSIGKVSLSFTAYKIASVSIDTSKFFLPISYRFDLTIANGGSVSCTNKIKLMNGSKLLIESGGALSVSSSLIVYDDFVETTTDLPSPYPDGLGPATLINNGTLSVTVGGSFGGYVSSTTAGAKTKLSSKNLAVSSPEYGGDMPEKAAAIVGSSCSTKNVTENAKGLLINDEGTSSSNSDFASGTYTSVVDPNDSTKFAWEEGEAVALVSVSIEQDASSDNTYKAVLNPEDVTTPTYKWTIDNSNIKISDSSTSTVKLSNSRGSDQNATLTLTVTDTFGNQKSATKFVTVKGSCLLPTAKVLMADGMYKEAWNVNTGDMVISFNHETGRFEPTLVIGNDHRTEEAQTYDVVKLIFSSGKTTEYITEHGYFDKDLNKYVYLHTNDYADYIGHEFVFYDNGKISTSKLISGSVREMYTTVCCPATANNLNFVVDNILNIGGGLDGLFNIFDYNPETLAFDDAKKREDIDRYGLLGYESFEKYFPEEIYNLLPCKYLNVSIGKGLLTWKTFDGYVLKWKDQLLENL